MRRWGQFQPFIRNFRPVDELAGRNVDEFADSFIRWFVRVCPPVLDIRNSQLCFHRKLLTNYLSVLHPQPQHNGVNGHGQHQRYSDGGSPKPGQPHQCHANKYPQSQQRYGEF